MNERILELAKQAGLYVNLEGSPWPRAMSAEECEAAYKKFAELIVQECAKIGELKEQGFRDYDPDMSVGWYMRKHFGFE